MNFYLHTGIRFFLSLCLITLFSACAPQNGAPEPEEEAMVEGMEIQRGLDQTNDSEKTEESEEEIRKRAYDQGVNEYEAWKKANPNLLQPTSTPKPTPGPTPTPEPSDDESTHSHEFPFSVEFSGRVPHVEDYIRKNAAFPDSLNVRTWWPVKPHDRGGYQVRVRYTLKSAGNLGTSYEDMIFFMYSNGRIHQRAPVK